MNRTRARSHHRSSRSRRQRPSLPAKFRTFTPSKYQAALRDAIENGDEHLVVQAVAGSGKTTSLEWICWVVRFTRDLLFLAFNKIIADELRKRFAPLNGGETKLKDQRVKAQTLNSLGHGTVTYNLRRAHSIQEVTLEPKKVYNICDDYFPDPEEPDTGKEQWELARAIARDTRAAVRTLVDLCRNTLRRGSNEDLDFLIDRYSVDLANADPKVVYESVPVILEQCRVLAKTAGIIDYNDQCWLPVVENWAPYPQSIIFGDEVQDWNPCQIKLALMVIKRGGRLIAVGDEFQSVYGFRGADTDAMDNLIAALGKTKRGVKTLPLSVCYRCPRLVIELVQKLRLVPNIQAADDAPEGEINSIGGEDKDDRFLQKVMAMHKAGDRDIAVLCRVNHELVRPCLQLIANGIRATIRGRDIASQLISMIERHNPKGNQNLDSLNLVLDSYSRREWERLAKAGRESAGMAVRDRYNTILALEDGAEAVDDVIKRIKEIFSDDDNFKGIVFSTGHRAKGLEWDHVFILAPEILGDDAPWAKQKWERQQESNIMYVMFTRAMRTLTFVGAIPQPKVAEPATDTVDRAAQAQMASTQGAHVRVWHSQGKEEDRSPLYVDGQIVKAILTFAADTWDRVTVTRPDVIEHWSLVGGVWSLIETSPDDPDGTPVSPGSAVEPVNVTPTTPALATRSSRLAVGGPRRSGPLALDRARKAIRSEAPADQREEEDVDDEPPLYRQDPTRESPSAVSRT